MEEGVGEVVVVVVVVEMKERLMVVRVFYGEMKREEEDKGFVYGI